MGLAIRLALGGPVPIGAASVISALVGALKSALLIAFLVRIAGKSNFWSIIVCFNLVAAISVDTL